MDGTTITENQRSALRSLKPAAEQGFYLAGGTALCLRLGHRLSIDLDLFREMPFEPQELLGTLQDAGVKAQDVRAKPNTLWFEVAGVRTSLMRFPYACVEPAELYEGIPVASVADIAAMKIEAIASRGARKDFYDLYFICEQLGGLPAAIQAFRKRFAKEQPDLLHRLKALTYFEDAEREPEPLLLRPASWHSVRGFFEQQVRDWWTEGRS